MSISLVFLRFQKKVHHKTDKRNLFRFRYHVVHPTAATLLAHVPLKLKAHPSQLINKYVTIPVSYYRSAHQTLYVISKKWAIRIFAAGLYRAIARAKNLQITVVISL